MDLNKKDIVDIANGYRNSYVDSQDKDELLRAVADKYLKATSDTIDIDDNLENIRDCLDDIKNKLYDAENVSDSVYDFCIRKLDDADKYLDEAKDDLQPFIE